MRLVILSDTHGNHNDVALPPGDVLIHCGDLFDGVNLRAVRLEEVDAWFARQPFDLILCTGGNHDKPLAHALQQGLPGFQHAHVLIDETVVYRGVHFYGAPWVPALPGWAFYRDDTQIEEAWAKIPTSTDVLITHTPPHGILDLPSAKNQHLGCRSLRTRVDALRPALHCFGHVHHSAGQLQNTHTHFINAALVGGRYPYELRRDPIVIDLPN